MDYLDFTMCALDYALIAVVVCVYVVALVAAVRARAWAAVAVLCLGWWCFPVALLVAFAIIDEQIVS
jgi:hypothetical protein